MSQIVPVLRAIVRDEIATGTGVELGVVTEVFTNDGGAGDHNLEVGVRLRGSALELQRVPVCTARAGVSAVPREGDLVVVGFVGGDLNGGVVLGVLHTADVHPPDATAEEVVYEVPDPAADGVRRAEIRLPTGNRVTVEDNVVVIDMGGSVVSVDGGKVTVTASEGITLESQADIVLKADGNISIEAMGNATVKASGNLSAEAGASARLAGAATTIAGMTSFSAG